MMIIPWPQVDTASAIIFGALTLVVGWLSYRAGVWSHDSQLRVEAMSLADETRLMLEEVDADRPQLFESFRGLFAAQGRLNSGATEEKRLEFVDLASTIRKLLATLATASTGIERLSGRKLEQRLGEIRTINVRASGLREKLAQYKREIREDFAEHRAHLIASVTAR